MEKGEQLGQEGFVPRDQISFDPALACVTERVEPRSPQNLQTRQHSEDRLDPRTELPLQRSAPPIPARRQEGRRKMIFYFEVAFELAPQFVLKSGLGMQARH